MALTSVLGPTLSLLWQDNNGKNATQSFFFPATVNTVALALTRATAIRDAARAISNARLLGANLVFPLTEDDGGAAGVEESEVERKLVASWIGANRRQRFTSELPSPIFALELPLTDAINSTDPLYIAYANAIVANAVTNRGEELVSGDGAPYIDHRNRRRS